ncbi:hypothetical protein BH11PSE11_BH11PSE11_36110 [soil metagenome]
MSSSPPLPSPDELKATMKAAMAHHNAGRLDQANAIYQQVLQAQPEHVDALHLSGLIANQSGQVELALTRIRKAIALKPDAAMIHNNLGNILLESGQNDEAMTSFERVLELNPSFVPALYNLGNLHYRANRMAQSRQHYEAALATDASFLPALVGLGTVLLDSGSHDEAISHFNAAIRQDPDYAEAHAGLGAALFEQGRFEQAQAALRQSLALDPANPFALIHLGNVLRERDDMTGAMRSFEQAVQVAPEMPDAHYSVGSMHLHRREWDQAVAAFQATLALDPRHAEAHYNLGNTYRSQGKLNFALGCYRRALQLKPQFMAARWVHCIAQIPILYDSVEEIDAAREAYRQALQKIEAELVLESAEQIREAAAAIGTIQPFLLAYQGRNDRDLQTLYGKLVCRIQAARYPQWSMPLSPRKRAASTPLRVGIASGFFYHHSNWKMPIKGWVENLDRGRFELIGYYTGQPSKRDHATEEARSAMKKFVDRFDNFEHLCQTILDDQLDVLIYPEVGMDPLTIRLASLRLAPVQCTSWGHPDTSGLPTIDYFLSSDLMEAADADSTSNADSHYSEKLVRLPNLSIHYTPLQHDAKRFDRARFKLSPDKLVYFCAQSLFKYLPQNDDVFPLIAKGAGACQFAFLDYPDSPSLTAKFRDRIGDAFTRHGLDANDYVVIVPHLNQSEYHGLNQVADVFLDSIGWSGCNSSLEALACDLPLVTLPGTMMRGRHTLAMLKMIGVRDTVAKNLNEYVAMAIRLGTDEEWRREIARKFSFNKHKLYGDRACIEGLETFLLAATGGQAAS